MPPTGGSRQRPRSHRRSGIPMLSTPARIAHDQFRRLESPLRCGRPPGFDHHHNAGLEPPSLTLARFGSLMARYSDERAATVHRSPVPEPRPAVGIERRVGSRSTARPEARRGCARRGGRARRPGQPARRIDHEGARGRDGRAPGSGSTTNSVAARPTRAVRTFSSCSPCSSARPPSRN